MGFEGCIVVSPFAGWCEVCIGDDECYFFRVLLSYFLGYVSFQVYVGEGWEEGVEGLGGVRVDFVVVVVCGVVAVGVWVVMTVFACEQWNDNESFARPKRRVRGN